MQRSHFQGADMRMDFSFNLRTKVHFSACAQKTITEILETDRYQNIGVVVDHNIMNVGTVEELLAVITNKARKVIVGLCTMEEPTYDYLDELRATYENTDMQAVVGIGGGSTLDTAKAMAVLINNRKPSIEYRGFEKMTEPVLPILAIPTTAGTGSEVTPNASFIDTREMKKLGINGEAVRPTYAILDPHLTLSCPKGPTLSAAIDSMVHATEAYAAKKTNPLARFFAREGFRRVFTNIEALINDLGNINVRWEVQYGAFLSGIALMHSGTGPAAAMSYPLGVHYHVPHGIAGGIFLPHVISFNIGNGYTDYAGLCEDSHFQGTTLNEESKALHFRDAIFQVWDSVGIPKDLTCYGLNGEKMESFIDETLELKGALEQNPVPFGRAAIEAVMSRLTSPH